MPSADGKQGARDLRQTAPFSSSDNLQVKKRFGAGRRYPQPSRAGASPRST
ncbi:hypothetical protein GCM10007860_25650 [Chitiniphilus shinanonensis]|uniref:Uncharacterized protein n=1 Tax=Chitiniphilus shinanonensis TaxID=553088 RepID=A0ABQ6BUP6_9NEIS|nr:hypothetical protein GCM10007860_25650 [Chitiniphilus shinanonensis]